MLILPGVGDLLFSLQRVDVHLDLLHGLDQFDELLALQVLVAEFGLLDLGSQLLLRWDRLALELECHGDALGLTTLFPMSAAAYLEV